MNTCLGESSYFGLLCVSCWAFVSFVSVRLSVLLFFFLFVCFFSVLRVGCGSVGFVSITS